MQNMSIAVATSEDESLHFLDISKDHRTLFLLGILVTIKRIINHSSVKMLIILLYKAKELHLRPCLISPQSETGFRLLALKICHFVDRIRETVF